MDIKIFSTKDYFNYSFAGIIWLSCIIVIFVQDLSSYNFLVESINKIPATILVIISLVIPFLLGFILSPLGNIITKLIRIILKDPTDWALVLKGQNYNTNKSWYRKRISEPSRTKILKKISTLQEGEPKYSPFYLVRNYVEIKGNDNARRLADRALDLANLTESIIIPAPLLVFLITRTLINQSISISISILLFLLLCSRYYQLRGYWVKHIYRTFLIIE